VPIPGRIGEGMPRDDAGLIKAGRGNGRREKAAGTARTPKRKRGREPKGWPKVLECAQSPAALAPKALNEEFLLGIGNESLPGRRRLCRFNTRAHKRHKILWTS